MIRRHARPTARVSRVPPSRSRSPNLLEQPPQAQNTAYIKPLCAGIHISRRPGRRPRRHPSTALNMDAFLARALLRTSSQAAPDAQDCSACAYCHPPRLVRSVQMAETATAMDTPTTLRHSITGRGDQDSDGGEHDGVEGTENRTRRAKCVAWRRECDRSEH